MKIYIDYSNDKNKQLSAILCYLKDEKEFEFIKVEKEEDSDLSVNDYDSTKTLIQALHLDFIPIIDENVLNEMIENH